MRFLLSIFFAFLCFGVYAQSHKVLTRTGAVISVYDTLRSNEIVNDSLDQFRTDFSNLEQDLVALNALQDSSQNIQDSLDDIRLSTIDTLGSYQDLRNYRGESNAIYLQNEGVAGLFVKGRTGIDNSATIIVTTSLITYRRVFSQFVDIRWFGALQSNADNTTQIRNAVNFCQISKNTLYVPPGTFNVSTTSAINGSQSCIGISQPLNIFSDGGIINYTGTAAGFSVISIFNTNKVNIEGLEINANGQLTSIGISISNANNVLIDRCTITTGGWTIYPQVATNFTVQNSTLRQVKDNPTVVSGNVIELQRCINCKILNNLIIGEKATFQAATSNPGQCIEIYTTLPANGSLDNVKGEISGNTIKFGFNGINCQACIDYKIFNNTIDSVRQIGIIFSDPEGGGVSVKASRNVIVSENSISKFALTSGGGSGISIGAFAQDVVVEKNTIFGNDNNLNGGGSGILVSQAVNCSIGNNTVRDLFGAGITISGNASPNVASRIEVENNYIYNVSGAGAGSRDGIALDFCDFCVVKSNVVSDSRVTKLIRHAVFLQQNCTNTIVEDNFALTLQNLGVGVQAATLGTNTVNSNFVSGNGQNNNQPDNPYFNRTGFFISSGTTAERTITSNGMFRSNNTDNILEFVTNGAWRPVLTRTNALGATSGLSFLKWDGTNWTPASLSTSLSEQTFSVAISATSVTLSGYTIPATTTNNIPVRVYENGIRLNYTASAPTAQNQFTYTANTSVINFQARSVASSIVVEYVR